MGNGASVGTSVKTAVTKKAKKVLSNGGRKLITAAAPKIKKTAEKLKITAKAAVLYEANQPFVIEEIEITPPKEGEVLIKVYAAGVCHSDWHVASGNTPHPFPVICGHEGAGVVEAVGPGGGQEVVRVGDHVALNWAPYCGRCFYCLRGKPSLCQEHTDTIWAGTMKDGTTRFKTPSGETAYHFSGLGCFSERVVVDESSCVVLSKDIPLEIAALVGCAVTTGVGSVFNTAKVEPCSSVVVFGCGGVGLSTILGAKLAGASTIIAVDIVDSKAPMATSFGATHFLKYGAEGEEEIAKQVQDLTEGRGADYVFEAIGSTAMQEAALACARPGGALVLSGLAPVGTHAAVPTALLTRQEKTIMGSYYGSCNAARDFQRYSDIHIKKQFDLSQLISKVYRLEEINEAYQEMLEGKLARGLLVFDEAAQFGPRGALPRSSHVGDGDRGEEDVAAVEDVDVDNGGGGDPSSVAEGPS